MPIEILTHPTADVLCRSLFCFLINKVKIIRYFSLSNFRRWKKLKMSLLVAITFHFETVNDDVDMVFMARVSWVGFFDILKIK